MDPELIFREMNDISGDHEGSSRIDIRKLLHVISEQNLIPMAVKPHSIFFLSSEQNFVAASFDWLLYSVAKTKEMTVSTCFSCSLLLAHIILPKFESKDVKKAYQGICRLTDESWAGWKLSPTVKEILTLSKTLRNDRKVWKAQGHQNKNRDRDPSDHECQACRNLSESHKCIQRVLVNESRLKHDVEEKLIIPEQQGAISPTVC